MHCHKFCRELKRNPPGAASRNSYFDMRTIELTDGIPRRMVTGSRQNELSELRTTETGGDACEISVVYHASAWERDWRNNIHERQSDDVFWTRGCTAMRQAANNTEHWLRYSVSQNSGREVKNLDAGAWEEGVFSYHEYIDSCTKRILARIPLEPLVGTLRHPHAVCDANEIRCESSLLCRLRKFMSAEPRRGPSRSLLSKEYMLPFSRIQFMASHNLTEPPRTFFFDLGASTYDAGGGGPSLRWFIDTYRYVHVSVTDSEPVFSHFLPFTLQATFSDQKVLRFDLFVSSFLRRESGLQFQRVFAWEAAEVKPAQIFEGMPNHLMTSISYFNIPVEDTKGGKNNPWRYVRDLTRPEDFVVVKIDIDTPNIEIELMRQLLMDDDNTNSFEDEDGVRLSELIDELYFEHHVWGSGLSPSWAGSGMDGDMVGSYTMFSQLRNLGIRAHSWV